MKLAFYWACGLTVWITAASVSAFAQDITGTPTPLATLILEAQSSNTQISAATHAWKAATHAAQQSTILPDPQFTVQSYSVGSPRPLAGFSNSDFAYIGFGASQEVPYGGKLRLKGETAVAESNMQLAQVDLLRSSITDRIKVLYLRLAYLDATLSILGRNDAVLKLTIETGLSRYSLGQGSQAEVLRAQMEHTKILREVTLHHEEMGQLQASLKQLLHRLQTSPNIVAEPLSLTSLHRSAEEMQNLVVAQSPAVYVGTASVHKQDAQLKSAQREGKPDFNVGYMFQQTGNKYRDYYMLTVSMRLPRRKRVEAGVAEAAESLERSKQELDSQVQEQLAEVQKQYITVVGNAELLTEYQEGLLPQARAAFDAEQTTYQFGKQGLVPVLSSLLSLLSFEHDYQQALLDHETAIAHLETLTGAQLR